MKTLRKNLEKLRLAQAGTASQLEIASAPIDKTFVAGLAARLAVSSEGQPQLLLPVARMEAGIPLPEANGLSLSVTRYKNTGVETQLFIQIRCMISQLETVFLDLSENICQRIREGGNAIACITAAIVEFRELLDGSHSDAGLAKVIGLFGELLVLEKALVQNENALAYWTGPAGGRRDYAFETLCIEVKTTQRSHQRQVTIHAIDQLATGDKKELYLWFYSVEEDPGAGSFLSELVARIEIMLDNIEPFRQLLEGIGYNEETKSDWDRKKWSVLESQPYLVDDKFPRITNESFDGGMPSGITHVTYRVDLDTAKQCRISETDVLKAITK